MQRTREDIIQMLSGSLVKDTKFIAGESYVPSSGKLIDDDDVICVINSALDGHFTEGIYAETFTKDLQRFLGVRSALLCNSGSSANLLAVTAITQKEFGSRSLRPGDEVITTAVGFPTTLSSIIQNKLVPVFVDVNFPTYNTTAEMVEIAISDRTKAIFIPHTLGNPFDLEAIRLVADENNLFLLSDGCDSLASVSGGRLVGSVEDISTLSFYPAHHITCGEAGAVITNSPMVVKVVESLRGWGRSCWCGTGKDGTCGKRFCQPAIAGLPEGYDHKYCYSRIGYNLKITDMQAALGVSQLKKLPLFVQKRRENHARLYEGLRKYDDYFILPDAEKGSEPSWFAFVLTLRKSLAFNRSELTQYLEAHNVGTRVLFGGNLLLQPAFSNIDYRISGKLFNSCVITTDSFFIGCHPALSDEMIDYTVSIFDDFIKLKGRNK